MSSSKLFVPVKVGNMSLQHRVVMAPLTRYKANPINGVPVVHLVKEYYSQRASTAGTLIIAESTLISIEGGGRPNTPGIWSEEQIAAWKEIVDAVHARGSYFYMQIRAMGRAADAPELEARGLQLVAPSPIAITGKPTPRALTTKEIKQYISQFAEAANNAVTRAGCDGVELHFANGYLGDQFLQDVSNQRDDAYGGSVEARSRFALETVDAVARAIGADRTAVRLSPWSVFLDMGMSDPVPQFSHLVRSLREMHPDLAFLHMIEPGIAGSGDATNTRAHVRESNDIFREIWAPRPFITAGAFTRTAAIAHADERGDLVAFGRLFIANPDLPLRLKYNVPLNEPDRKTFYVPATKEGTEVGYIDYPFSEELRGITEAHDKL